MKNGLMAVVFTVAAVLITASVSLAGSDIINGAGASFPYPVYAQWAYKFGELKNVRINYQSIGSGGGIAQIKANTVDFGASDAPLKPEELNKAGLVQFPMIVGGVVPVVNIKGIGPGQVKLTPELLADIFLGKLTRWDDPAVKAVNPGLNLPGKSITVVHRADGSGTTWIYTNYLDKVSKQWHEKVGTDKAVDWPTGVGGKGNEGVASYVQRVSGSIGYVEYAYAIQNKLAHVQLKNKSGNFVSPTIKTFQAAAANADWKNAPGYYMVLTDQPGKESWPITGASFILMHKSQADAAKAKAVLSFFDWSYNKGQDMAVKLDYVPIPKNVVELVEKTWTGEIKAGGKPVWK
jgi:phosphate transport system substrate-binding protein